MGKSGQGIKQPIDHRELTKLQPTEQMDEELPQHGKKVVERFLTQAHVTQRMPCIAHRNQASQISKGTQRKNPGGTRIVHVRDGCFRGLYKDYFWQSVRKRKWRAHAYGAIKGRRREGAMLVANTTP